MRGGPGLANSVEMPYDMPVVVVEHSLIHLDCKVKVDFGFIPPAPSFSASAPVSARTHATAAAAPMRFFSRTSRRNDCHGLPKRNPFRTPGIVAACAYYIHVSGPIVTPNPRDILPVNSVTQ